MTMLLNVRQQHFKITYFCSAMTTALHFKENSSTFCLVCQTSSPDQDKELVAVALCF